MSMVTVKIDGVEVEVPAGTNMIEAARKIGVEIPHYCYHPHLTVAGNCRMCLVDIEAGGRGPDIACNLVAREGLAIRTDTRAVAQMRKAVMEFLLVNHPLDCPICDQSGECRLQDYYMKYGHYESRLADPKVNKKKRQDIGTQLILDAERCVHCSRCVRFGDEITRTGELRLFNRTNRTEIGVFPGDYIEHRYQGNLADICPVGAITTKDFRFRKRVWYLRESPSICNGCATGCNILVCHENGEIFRYLPRRNDEVNQSWMCDLGREGFERIGCLDRVLRARVDGRVSEVDWATEKLADLLRAAVASHGAHAVGVVLGCQATNEANWALAKVVRSNLPDIPIFTCEGNDPGAETYHDDLLVSRDKNPNTRGAVLLAKHFGGTDCVDLAAKVDLGGIEVLMVLQDDVIGRLGELAEKVEVLAWIGTWRNRTSDKARVVLPASAYVEMDGTWVNRQGRVQRLHPVVPPAGDSRPAYALFEALGARLGKAPGTGRGREAFDQLARAVPAFAGMSYESVGWVGQLLRTAEPSEALSSSEESEQLGV